MNKLILGFHGGSTIYRLGSRYDLKLFFLLVTEQCSLIDHEYYLLNRLRVSYIKHSDMKKFKHLINKIEECFKSIPVLSLIDDLDTSKSTLEWDQATLYDVFDKFFDGLLDVYEDCEYIFTFSERDGGARHLIRTIITNIPLYDWFNNISLEYYDSLDLDGEALWEQPTDYIEEVYNANRLEK